MTSKQILVYIAVIVCSYCFGNINFAVIISKLKHSDIRRFGSGNPGAMNMLRNFGAGCGTLTLFLDAMKGFIPSMAAKLIFSGQYVFGAFELSDLALFSAGLAACIGHILPVFMKFKGGKGVATTLGMFIAFDPIVSIAIFVLGVLYIYFFEYGSMGSLLFLAGMAINVGIKLSAKYAPNGVFLNEQIIPYCVLLSSIVFTSFFTTFVAHRHNVYNLIFGNEHKTQLQKIIKKSTQKES